MEPIPYFFDTINRSAIVIKPKKPFYEWLTKMDPKTGISDYEEDSDIYLIPDFDEIEQIKNWLKKNFDLIFCDQMNGWYTNESSWIQNRTFKLFKEYFDYSLHTMILDTQDTPLKKL